MELKPGYKQTEVGVIPEDWEVRRLSDLAKIRSGIAKNSKASLSNPVTVPYLRVANVQDGFLDLGEVSSISIGRDDLERYLLRPGDVLMNEGGDLDKLGRGAIWRDELKQCIHQNHVFAIRCTAALLPEFLNAWASGKAARRYFVVAGKQTTNLASINKTAIGGLPIALPSPREQQQIAEALDSLSAHEASLEDLIAKKMQIKQAAMQELLTGKRRLSGFEGEWEVKKLGEICEIGMGRTPSRLDESMWGAGHPWLSIADLKGKVVYESKEQITESAAAHMTILRKGTLLMSFKLSIGRLCFAGCDLFTNEAICSFNRLSVNADYLYYALGRTDFSLYGKQAVKGFTLNKESLNLIEVKLPSQDEQTAIASVLSEMDAELTALEARGEKARVLKEGMMQELLTGKTRLAKLDAAEACAC
jgi:type I restriction enzyme S subunit